MIVAFIIIVRTKSVTIIQYTHTITKNVMRTGIVFTTQTIHHQIIAKNTLKIIDVQFTEVWEEWLGFSPPMLYLSSLDLWG